MSPVDTDRLSGAALVLAGSLLVLVAAAMVLTARWLSTINTTILASRLAATPLGIELRAQSGDDAVGGSRSGLSISHSEDLSEVALEALRG